MKDVISAIPESMERFFGRSGRMVKPSEVTVANLVAQIPDGKLVTIDELRRKVAVDFSVDVTCPATTVKALRLIATNQPKADYWRVIKRTGEMIPQLPGGVEGHATKLVAEGFDVEFRTTKPRVVEYESRLFEFS